MIQFTLTLDGGGDGSDYTIIRAKTVTHTLKVYQDGARTKAFEYKRKDDGTPDGFTTVFTTQAGDPIALIGHGRSGLLGRPPGYCGTNPVTGLSEPVDTAAGTGDSGGGDPVLYIKAADGSTPVVQVIESESEF